MFMEIPEGVDKTQLEGKILRVKRSLYGHKFAAKLFYQLIRDALTKPVGEGGLGFTLSDSDHCLFLRHDCMLVTWVDDAIIVSKDPNVADQIVARLKKLDFNLEKEDHEGGLQDYLGIDFNRMADGSLECTQKGLIDRIIEAAHLQDANPKDTPIAEPLGRCQESPTFSREFNYRSLIGMLMYLCNTTRPDIAYAVMACARFSHDPREPHGKAVKRIVCYLKKTRDLGLVIRPTESHTLDCWADADFAGQYGKEDPQDPTSCRSRSGYVITLGGNPLVWSSKLQTEVALHTMEAEYIACSVAMKMLLFLRNIHSEISQHCTSLGITRNSKSTISTVFQDNQAALILATTDPPRMTPRSKSIAVKYHWFRQHLGPSIVMQHAPSKQMLANILTKPLPRQQFQEERDALMNITTA
jgi:hypothetical protein